MFVLVSLGLLEEVEVGRAEDFGGVVEAEVGLGFEVAEGEAEFF